MIEVIKEQKMNVNSLGKVVAILLGEAAIGYAFDTIGLSEIHIFTIYVLGIVVTALVTASQVWSILSVCGIFVFNYFFAYPLFSFDAYHIGYPFTFIILLIAALMVATLAKRNEQRAKKIAQFAYHSQVLLETEQQLQRARCQQEIIEVTAKRLMKILERNIVVFVEKDGCLGTPQIFLTESQKALSFELNPMELETALWVYQNSKSAGAFTEVFSFIKGTYMPIHTEERNYGVIGIDFGGKQLLSSEANVVIGECALAFEREYYNRAREKAAVQAKNEKLRSDLLRSISHDLRTPLTTISGNAALLSNQGKVLTEEKRKALSNDIWKDATDLISMVENLLAITKLGEVEKNIKIAPELLEDILLDAFNSAKKRHPSHQFDLILPEEVHVVNCNAQLMMQVMGNLLGNAVKYSKEGTKITIRMKQEQENAVVEVEDEGEGVPEQQKEQIFQMFYTTSGKVSDRNRGFGIGLALCKTIITAHGGKIWVSDAKPHGAVFTFTLKKARETV